MHCKCLQHHLVGMKRLIIESDSRVVLSWMRESREIVNHIDACLHLIGNYKFKHTLQEASSFVDALTKFGVERERNALHAVVV